MIHFISQPLNNFLDSQFILYLGYIGLILIGIHIYPLVFQLLCYLLPEKNLKLLYNKNGKNYALVSGCTEGVGKEFAQNLAKKGFNLILIARNEQKLKNVKEQIQKTTKNIDIQYYVFDFKNIMIQDQSEKLSEFINKFDISIFINNVGVLCMDLFENLEFQNVQDLMTINCGAISVMNHLQLQLYKKQHQKQEKMLIINISSLSGQFANPFYQIYGASKAYVTHFSSGLIHEMRNDKNIEIMVVKPNFVKTQMTGNKLGITTEQCVNGVFRMVGKCPVTDGHWIHQFMNYITELITQENSSIMMTHKFIKKLTGL